MVALRVFSRVRRQAQAWMKAPGDDALASVAGSARDATEFVPEARRADWTRLLAGFVADEAPARRRARVEALARACAMFEREQRAHERQARRLDWGDPVDAADGLGPASRDKLAAHGVSVVSDLVWMLPVGWDDLRAPVGVASATEAARAAQRDLAPSPRVCVRGVVQSAALVPMRGRRAVRLVVADPGGAASLEAWWFFAAHGVLASARVGATCVLVGRVRARDGKRPIMAHPDLVRDDEARGLRPRYAATGLAPGTLRRAVRDVLARCAPLPDPVPAAIAAREAMPDVDPLLRAVHGEVSGEGPGERPGEARRALAARLAWVEAFTRVWQRLLAERAWGAARAPVLGRDEACMARVVAALGFSPTGAQTRAIDAVARDLASTTPMRRLLLGDVGTGKTAVALAAAAQCAGAGHQCALLVPTTILAEQYVEAATPVMRAIGARLERLTAGMRAADRRRATESIASGDAQVVVGTHALLEEGVSFARLGLVVIDEQQRLGVAQRLSLVRKGEATRPHLLSLSATPIPRTLALALRGELATSVLDERPRGRRPPVTALRPRSRAADVLEEMRATVARGERAFFVCPRIDDDEEEERLGAHARAEQLGRELAPARVVLVHGAMPLAARAQAMRAFRRGEAQVLVGTTVVEVGVDVPEATLMVVDCADQFGLAQLHQLRGRVGRGEREGRCVLMHDEPLIDTTRRRLEALVQTSDGAEVARADLAMRGAGDLVGTRQSGVVEDLAWLDPADPPAFLERIDADATAILARDPDLRSPDHRALALAVRRFAVALAVREEAG